MKYRPCADPATNMRTPFTIAAAIPILAAAHAADPPAGFVQTLYPHLNAPNAASATTITASRPARGSSSRQRALPPPKSAASACVSASSSTARIPNNPCCFKSPRRVFHTTGGERIARGGAEDAALRSWVEYLATRPETAEVREETGSARAVLRRLTHSQYNHTVRDLLGGLAPPDHRAGSDPREAVAETRFLQQAGQERIPLEPRRISPTGHNGARGHIGGAGSLPA